jgi:CobW/HypB/UreG, nucleotide-binding domain/WD domain, G-beta repeat
MTTDGKVPVTVLTGFLGSGKTTLLNHILTEQHGMKIAVIENEFGEVGIDDALVLDAEEEIFEMNNGCICCTVRGDLIRILGNLMKRRDRFDTAAAWSADGTRVGVSAYGGINWYDTAQLSDPQPKRVFAWKGSLLSLAVSPTGRWACGGAQDQSIHVWKLWSGDDLQMTGYPSKIEHIEFRHDGRWMASACLAEVTLWDFGGKGPDGTAPAAGTAHERHITALAWEPTGDRLATVAADGRLAVWSSPRKAGKSMTPVWVAEDPTGAASVAWLPAGGGVLVGRADGTVERRPC